MQKITIVIFLVMHAAAAMANDVNIPYVFKPGTPARAAEVNQNFSILESGVDDNASQIAGLEARINEGENSASGGSARRLVAVDASGKVLPVWVTGGSIEKFEGYYEYGDSLAYVRVASDSGRGQAVSSFEIIVYATPDCSGQSYVYDFNLRSDLATRDPILIVANKSVYQVNRSAPQVMTVGSEYLPWQNLCLAGGTGSATVYPLTPIGAIDFMLPLHLEVR